VELTPGAELHRRRLPDADLQRHRAAALVRFTPGARTNWHSHAVGQTLHITEGVGLVGC
jgi:quercetin dioxygenase-like cupin family protein